MNAPPGFPASNLGSKGKRTNGEDQAVSYDTHTVQAAAPARKRTQLPLADMSSFGLGIGSDYCICLTVQKRGGRGEKGSTRGPKAGQVESQVGANACPVWRGRGNSHGQKPRCQGVTASGRQAQVGRQSQFIKRSAAGET